MSRHDVKKQKTFDLKLTKFELIHLRDVMSVSLPPDLKKTVSQAIADLESRPLVESMLWTKVSNACDAAGLPLDDQAPDYVVAPSASPPMAVFQLASEPDDPSGEEQQSAGFVAEEPD